MIKMFVSDLDGTLLNDEHVILPQNIEAIRIAKKKGYRFMVATGRSLNSVKSLLDPLHIQCPCILLNGALFVDENGDIKREIFLENHTVGNLLKKMEELDIVYYLYTREGVARKDLKRAILEYKESLRERYGKTEEEIDDIVSNSNFFETDVWIHDIDTFLNSSLFVYKMEAFSNNGENIKKLRSYAEHFSNINIVGASDYHIEITHQDAHKGEMLSWVLSSMGLESNEVAVFGDNENDISMLKRNANSYAMKNAKKHIQEVANYIAPTNNDAGVGKVMLEIIRNQISNKEKM